jgi:peptidylprolyl isomerase
MLTPQKASKLLSLAAASAVCVSVTAACSSSSSSSTTTSIPTTSAAPSTSATTAAGGTASGTNGIASIPTADLSPAGKIGHRPTVKVPTGNPPTQLESGDLIMGTGATAQAGQTVTVQYDGYSWTNKKEFDASWNRGQTFSFPLGQGQVIQGWDQGVVGMKVGGRRELVIPPTLAYGSRSPSPDIASNDTLIFVVDLVSIG